LANVQGLDQLVANTDLLIRDALDRLPGVELVDLHSAAQGYVILEIDATDLRARYVLLAPGNVRRDYTAPQHAELLDALAFGSEFKSTHSAQGLTLEKLTSAPTTTRLQLLHASDLEGGVEAIADAPNFAAITEYLRASEPRTLVVNAGDSYIPGPFFGAAGDPALRSTLRGVNETLGRTTGLDIREGVGRADLTLMNIIGFDASCLGNHEFDSGTAILRELIATDIRGATPNTVRWLGAQFPFLSANLDFASDGNLSGLTAAHGGQLTTDFQSLPTDLDAARRAPKLAPSTLAVRDGQVFGLVGATTPLLAQISSPGATRVSEPGAGSNNMADLASILQPVIDSLLDQGVNKIILVTHLQQLPLEQQLVPLLRGVDIAIAGGSDSILANPGWPLRSGAVATGPYPIVTQNAAGEPALIVSTDGQYKYVGRLLVDFDDTGVLQLDSLDPETIGPWPTESDVVHNLWGSLEAAFAPGTRGDLARQVTEGVLGVVNAKDGNLLGRTRVFIEGRRALVRTEETTLGNLSADANLVLAQSSSSHCDLGLPRQPTIHQPGIRR
jgi:2',3'-cyclic-nucleotide 2'-phosphodiesterase (5'-nucleotidase family)